MTTIDTTKLRHLAESAKAKGKNVLSVAPEVMLELLDQINELERSAEMACQEPDDHCDCAGCLLARHRAEAGEL